MHGTVVVPQFVGEDAGVGVRLKLDAQGQGDFKKFGRRWTGGWSSSKLDNFHGCHNVYRP